ncbi:uncharacterized protein LOC121374645 [Gigantopelta aegis]|uniref:uncharacterized protein LOC121374645 n=1 Tax=Gigantopelta aegis TaxID=1735272 RepID=UPI001B88916C|nr:uncharacterized protein LOC121374645 [Gigantopelta aegis]
MADSKQSYVNSLESYFRQMCQTYLIPNDTCMHWWSVIEEKYSELKRHYHTLDHLKDMFDHYEKWFNNLRNPTSVAYAIFFHDIIYDPTLDTNEMKSIECFKEFASQGALSEDLQKEVIENIQATITHVPEVSGDKKDSDVLFFLDFDMAVLGKEERGKYSLHKMLNTYYNRYASQIRLEYSHLSDDTYKAKRAQVLEGFLSREHIFTTKEFQKQYEAQARKNICNEISQLRT